MYEAIRGCDHVTVGPGQVTVGPGQVTRSRPLQEREKGQHPFTTHNIVEESWTQLVGCYIALGSTGRPT